ncbi:hypothetical protein TIFTF001_007966 [Ficus carica]|uniref:Transmembrane protein n=1 Tax=Ficus carica TaxID=3494 RepID=A0AA87ZS73_FICCA|nr:hypothetical protein TIFTF001_007966 [Ficus carica]
MLVPSEGWVRAVSELSVESWSPFIVLRSGCVRREGLWIPRELGCGAALRGLATMVAPTLMGVALLEIAVVPLFSFVCNLCLFVIRAKVSPLVLRVGFCVDRVLVVVWWADLAFASPVVGVFLRVWDRGLLRLSPSRLITCVLFHWFVDFRSIWWFPSRLVAGRLAYFGFCSMGLSLY